MRWIRSLFIGVLILPFLALAQVFALEPHKSTYAVFNSGPNADGVTHFLQNIKFQLSVKEPIYESEALEASFGYTQLSFWPIGDASSPFKEHNFSPELFFVFKKASLPGPITFGVEHNSNGVGGPTSRSWNRVYLQSDLLQSRIAGTSIEYGLNFKVWTPFMVADDNEEITDYLGYYRFVGKVKGRENEAHITLYRGAGLKDESYRGTMQLDIFPSGFFPLLKEGKWYVQIFHGYGESLQGYNEYVDWKVMVGVVVGECWECL